MEGRIIHIDPEILGSTPVFYRARVCTADNFDILLTIYKNLLNQ